MLHTITWLQFVSFLFICLGIYYAYVLIRYYNREVLDYVLKRRGQVARLEADAMEGPSGKEAGRPEVVDRSGPGAEKGMRLVSGKTAGPDGVQGEMFEGQPGEHETPKGFRQMEKAVALLQALTVDWSVTTLRREELEEEIGKILSGYRQLRGTEYEVAINNYLERTCKTRFALTLADEDVKRLWDQWDAGASAQETKGW